VSLDKICTRPRELVGLGEEEPMRFGIDREDLDRILAALDSHVYWQLSDQQYRHDADVMNPGSDDPEQAAEIAACRELSERIAAGR
jgi:hypothetical protein